MDKAAIIIFVSGDAMLDPVPIRLPVAKTGNVWRWRLPQRSQPQFLKQLQFRLMPPKNDNKGIQNWNLFSPPPRPQLTSLVGI